MNERKPTEHMVAQGPGFEENFKLQFVMGNLIKVKPIFFVKFSYLLVTRYKALQFPFKLGW